MGKSNLCKEIEIIMIIIITALGLGYVCSDLGSKAYFVLSNYIAAVLLYLIVKKYNKFFYKTKEYNLIKYSISVVMVVEGEETESLIRTVKSLLNQEYPLKEIFIISSNSKNLNVYNIAKKISKQVELYKESGIKGDIDLGDINTFPDIIVKRLDGIQERRFAESFAFIISTGDIILTCKPNSVIEKNGIKELIKPFEDSFVFAVTKIIKVNRKDSCKTKKILSNIKEKSNNEKLRIYKKLTNVFCDDSSFRCYRRKILNSNIYNYFNYKKLK